MTSIFSCVKSNLRGRFSVFKYSLMLSLRRKKLHIVDVHVRRELKVNTANTDSVHVPKNHVRTVAYASLTKRAASGNM